MLAIKNTNDLILKPSKPGIHIPESRRLLIGFTVVSLIGGLLLLLPISQTTGANVSFLDCWFTSTSAVCVTGLITVDTSKVWSTFGQVVICF